ncbi:MAG: hypothetical protein IPL26_19875 [Leptospiraceae bacterium]|nr:hypothetical protein [Leptospiraceae bacterium]
MYPQAHINKFKYYVLFALGLYTLLIVLLTNNLNGKSIVTPKAPVVIYELIIDFGNDAVFLHEVTKDQAHCRFRAITIMAKEDNVKAYCIKRISVSL